MRKRVGRNEVQWWEEEKSWLEQSAVIEGKSEDKMGKVKNTGLLVDDERRGTTIVLRLCSTIVLQVQVSTVVDKEPFPLLFVCITISCAARLGIHMGCCTSCHTCMQTMKE